MKDPYSILGITSDATDEEVKNAYRALARKYHPDNYGDDNPLKDLANEKMQEINSAYEEILATFDANGNKKSEGAAGSSDYTGGSSSGIYAEIRKTVNDRRFRDAERMMGSVPESERTAEWHYLAAVLLMHRGRQNDAMRELEIACTMDPSNMEYQKAKEMFNGFSRGYGNDYYRSAGNGQPTRSSTDECCNCCTNLICLDCCCECMGGDLIPCL